MLDSNLHLADLVVCVDTGSTDHTEQLIENWAKKIKYRYLSSIKLLIALTAAGILLYIN